VPKKKRKKAKRPKHSNTFHRRINNEIGINPEEIAAANS
jgi:hypothetical protein